MKRKNKQVMKALKDYNFDIIGLSEVNIHWRLGNPADYWGKESVDIGKPATQSWNVT